MIDYEKAKAMACPRCAAKPGDPCINANGNKMWLLHPPRWGVARRREEAKRFQRWAEAAIDLVAKTPRVYLNTPCPRCEASWAYRHSDGQQLPAPALWVSETGCECLACGAFWEPGRFEWLARLLGCPALSA